MSDSQVDTILERWWNQDPEFRYAEVLCGENWRFCVRLYQIVAEEPGVVMVAKAEAGTLLQATQAAVHYANSPEDAG